MDIFSRQKNKGVDARKFDGIIEAVRRNSDGQVEMARFYERRGPAWSDHMLISRSELINRLKKGDRFAIGERMEYLGGSFRVITPVQLSNNSGRERITTGSSQDGSIELKEAPLF